MLREAFLGVRRFADFQRILGAPKAVLTERLGTLVAAGVLARVPYQAEGERQRHEYRLTDKGRDLYPTLVALRQWGDRYLAEGGVRRWRWSTGTAVPTCGSSCLRGRSRRRGTPRRPGGAPERRPADGYGLDDQSPRRSRYRAPRRTAAARRRSDSAVSPLAGGTVARRLGGTRGIAGPLDPVLRSSRSCSPARRRGRGGCRRGRPCPGSRTVRGRGSGPGRSGRRAGPSTAARGAAPRSGSRCRAAPRRRGARAGRRPSRTRASGVRRAAGAPRSSVPGSAGGSGRSEVTCPVYGRKGGCTNSWGTNYRDSARSGGLRTAPAPAATRRSPR